MCSTDSLTSITGDTTVKHFSLGAPTMPSLALIGLIGVVVTASPAIAQQGQAQGQGQGAAPVQIVNPLPVPVTVSGDIGGTVAATQSGTWSVGVNNTVLVKNLNEPGREPYEYGIEFDSSSCSFNCSNFAHLGQVIVFDGPVVPAGKRLIVQHVSGRLPNTGSDEVSVLLQAQQVLAQQTVKWAFYGPFFIQSTMPGFSAEAFATYGPGERPHFNLRLPVANNFLAYVSIAGYLIDATN